MHNPSVVVFNMKAVVSVSHSLPYRTTKSFYNERFSFADPSAPRYTSRTTRHRMKKRKAIDDSSAASSEGDSAYDYTSCSTLYLESRPLDEESDDCENLQDSESPLEAYNITDHPLSLEAEIVSPLENEAENDECELSSPPSSSEASGPLTSLYEGSSLTLASSSVLIIKYKMRHNLTQEALGDLLQLIKLHCPSPNRCPSSVYQFKKGFPDLNYPITMHYFCSRCLHAIDDVTVKVCTNTSCNCDFSARDSLSSFIEVSLDSQLTVILEGECM